VKKNLLLLCTLFIILVSACKKDSSDNFAAEQAIADETQIKAYIDANRLLNVVKDPSGLYYQIQTPGTGAYPTATSTVNVNYRGTFTDGTQFDSGNYTTVVNGNVIEGWKIGLPKINKDGRILLLIPSALAYGPQGRDRIPANKVLVYQIDMLSIK
jgi:FKBP-type peptidyl-prolyl cis-trans isomerase FkpA